MHFWFRFLFFLEMDNHILVSKVSESQGRSLRSRVYGPQHQQWLCIVLVLITCLFIHSFNTHLNWMLLHARYCATLMVLFTQVKYFSSLLYADFILLKTIFNQEFIYVRWIIILGRTMKGCSGKPTPKSLVLSIFPWCSWYNQHQCCEPTWMMTCQLPLAAELIYKGSGECLH